MATFGWKTPQEVPDYIMRAKDADELFAILIAAFEMKPTDVDNLPLVQKLSDEILAVGKAGLSVSSLLELRYAASELSTNAKKSLTVAQIGGITEAMEMTDAEIKDALTEAGRKLREEVVSIAEKIGIKIKKQEANLQNVVDRCSAAAYEYLSTPDGDKERREYIREKSATLIKTKYKYMHDRVLNVATTIEDDVERKIYFNSEMTDIHEYVIKKDMLNEMFVVDKFGTKKDMLVFKKFVELTEHKDVGYSDIMSDKLIDIGGISSEEGAKYVEELVTLDSSINDMFRGNKNYSLEELKRDIAFFYRITGGKLPKLTVKYKRGGPTGRAYANQGKCEVVLRQNSTKETVLHELGHIMEGMVDEFSGVCRQYIAERATGEPTSLNRLYRMKYGIKVGYDAKEKAYPGNFYTPYIAKYYPDGSTEVLSCGIQEFSNGSATVTPDEKGIDSGIIDLIIGICTTNGTFVASAAQKMESKVYQRKSSEDIAKSFVETLKKDMDANNFAETVDESMYTSMPHEISDDIDFMARGRISPVKGCLFVRRKNSRSRTYYIVDLISLRSSGKTYAISGPRGELLLALFLIANLDRIAPSLVQKVAPERRGVPIVLATEISFIITAYLTKYINDDEAIRKEIYEYIGGSHD